MNDEVFLCSDLIEKEGWTKYEQFGRGYKYHKGFDGNSWYELFFSDTSGEIIITHHRPFLKYEPQVTRFNSKCYTLEKFKRIINILGI